MAVIFPSICHLYNADRALLRNHKGGRDLFRASLLCSCSAADFRPLHRRTLKQFIELKDIVNGFRHCQYDSKLTKKFPTDEEDTK